MADIVSVLANGLMLGGLYMLVALGLSLVFGVSDIVNFAHGEFLVWGAYTTYVLHEFGLPPLAALPLAMVLTGLLGTAVYTTTFRWLGSDHMKGVVVSIGLIVVSQTVATQLFTVTARSVDNPFPGSVSLLGAGVGRTRVIVLFLALAIVVVLSQWLRRTQQGRALRALTEADVASRLVGIRPERLTGVSFAVAAGLAGVAGSFIVMLFSVTPFTGLNFVLKAFIVVIIGGLGSLPGVALGALFLGILESGTTWYVGGDWVSMFGFGAMALILLVRPTGLLGSGKERVG